MTKFNTMTTVASKSKLDLAYYLALITIFYNLIEGGVSTFFGTSDETLALFGFGVDSFVEVLSGIGIAHMILRMKNHPVENRDQFEVTALRITGTAFYLLVAGLVVGAFLSIYYASEPETTRVGVIISILSIVTMYFLYRYKLKVGHELDSQPIISDANCTKTCFYLSFILLASSLLYELFKIPYVDALGSLGIAWYAFKEGREAFEKAKRKSVACGDGCC
ncbi:MAG: cation transporter [Cyclobacteriaceae bacterium]|nr:cation transporter [Cyclobacteriaceae bacterium SS2]